MKRFKNHIKQRQSFRYSYIILICILLTSIIFISFETNAEQKEFQLKSYDQKLQFQKNGIKSIDINYREGEKLEFVFNIQVKDNLPIDIWFVNEDNYLLLSNGAQFLFYIDGSGSQLSYAKRIVTLTEHDNYKLVMTNYYANQSIQLDISYELRTYYANSEETDNSSIIFYSLVIIVAALVILIIFLYNIIHKNKKKQRQININNSVNKSRKNQSKPIKQNSNQKKSAKNSKTDKTKKRKSKTNKKTPIKTSIATTKSDNFCGYCGKQMDTPFCKNCGKSD